MRYLFLRRLPLIYPASVHFFSSVPLSSLRALEMSIVASWVYCHIRLKYRFPYHHRILATSVPRRMTALLITGGVRLDMRVI